MPTSTYPTTTPSTTKYNKDPQPLIGPLICVHNNLCLLLTNLHPLEVLTTMLETLRFQMHVGRRTAHAIDRVARGQTDSQKRKVVARCFKNDQTAFIRYVHICIRRRQFREARRIVRFAEESGRVKPVVAKSYLRMIRRVEQGAGMSGLE